MTEPIDEQILAFKMIMRGDPVDDAILASLERLKKIDAVQVLDEVVGNRMTLRDLLKSIVTEELKQCKHNASVTMDELGEMRIERDIAESKLAQIEKMGREPSEGMKQHGKTAMFTGAWESEESEAAAIFTAMFAKMMEELK
jgi:hypothetical protein